MIDVRGGHVGTSAFVPFVVPRGRRWWVVVYPFRVLGCVGKGHEQTSQIRPHKHEVTCVSLLSWYRHAENGKGQETVQNGSCFHDDAPFFFELISVVRVAVRFRWYKPGHGGSPVQVRDAIIDGLLPCTMLFRVYPMPFRRCCQLT